MSKEISKIIKEWKDEAGIGPERIILVGAFPSTRDTITICTDLPGLMIGKNGDLVNKYKAKLKVINPKLETIEFVETEKYYIR